MISLEANEKTLREKDMALQPVPLNTTPDETYFRKKVVCGKEFLELNALMVGVFGGAFSAAAMTRDLIITLRLKSVTMRVIHGLSRSW